MISTGILKKNWKFNEATGATVLNEADQGNSLEVEKKNKNNIYIYVSADASVAITFWQKTSDISTVLFPGPLTTWYHLRQGLVLGGQIRQI